MTDLNIAGRRIGQGAPLFLIAEIGQSHDGSLGIAHSYIEAVAQAGADAIKFQTHIAEAESTPGEPFRINFSYEDASRYEYWHRMEFTEEQWQGLADHCQDLGLVFLSSPFSLQAVALLDRIGMPAWKVGSGEVNNPLILEAMMRTGKPILLSTGMSDWAEIEASVSSVKSCGTPLALFQCSSKYPTAMKDVGLNVAQEMQQRFDVPVGISDHSGTIYPAIAAMSLGFALAEVHVVFSKEMFGPDTSSSITLDELKQLVDARDAIYEMIANPIDKDAMAKSLSGMRQLFNKSVALIRDAVPGELISEQILAVKKPGTGIPASEIKSLVGKKLCREVHAGSLLSWEDIEDIK